jgi:beta-galactosidase
MKKLHIFLIIIIVSHVAYAQMPDWQNQHVIARNKLAPHASFITFNEVRGGADMSESDQYQSLNGKWSFNWSKSPGERPMDFYKSDYDTSSWDKIPVPANWQLHGYGYPIYINHPYEFADRRAPFTEMKSPVPPLVPNDYNPVGSYRHRFTLPQG